MVEAIRLRARGVRGDVEQRGGAELRVAAVLGPSHDEPAYRLLEDDVLDAVSVTEVSEGGSVPELIVRNPLDVMVYLLDGQELIGAKQNRILNTDVLVPAGATLRIPVSCVEQGRWNYVSDKFSPSRRTASHRTRRDKLARVHASLACDAGHDADQGAVWDEVRMELESTGSVSDTGALHAAYEQREADLAALRQDLRLPDDAVGLAIFDGTGFQGLDLFDRHSTLVYFWQSLLDSYALSWLGRRGESPPAEPAQATPQEQRTIDQVLEHVADGAWERFDSPGEGQDYRLSDDAFTGAALVWDERVVVHLQAFPRAVDQRASDDPHARARLRRPRLRRRYGPRRVE